MKLTHEDLATLGDYAEVISTGDHEYVVLAGMIDDLVAAYERVAALLEHEYEYSATIPWEKVRRALEGGK